MIFCGGLSTLLEDPIIKRDREIILNGLDETRRKGDGEDSRHDEMPMALKVALKQREGDLKGAYEYMKEELDEYKNDEQFSYEYATTLAKLKKTSLLKKFIQAGSIEPGDKTYYLLFTGDDSEVVKKATSVLRSEPGSWAARINRAIAYKRLGMIDEMNNDLDELEERMPAKSYVASMRAGVAALRKDKKTMLKMLDMALDRKNISIEDAKVYPVFEDYRDDKDFQSLIARKGK